MPRFDAVAPGVGPRVTGFSDGRFVVDGVAYGAVLLTPAGVESWSPPAIGDLSPGDIGSLLALDPLPEFILLGSGPRLIRPPSAFVRAIEDQGIGIEVMDSRAAARAWGVLRAEDRRIAAALMALA